MRPLVSVVIPVYNGEDYLDEAIRSALSQTYKNIEILVVNDGSMDRTEEIVKAYGDKVRYYSKPNGGVATALNLAIREMRGEYFSWLSHDDYYYPEKVELEIEAIEKQGDREAIAYCDYSLLDQETGVFSEYKIEEYYSETERRNGTLMVMQRMMDGGSMLIHVNHFQRVGMFDENLRTTQDYDMWFRMLRGEKVVHVPKVLVVARVHKKQGSQTMKEFFPEREQLFLRFLRELSDEEKVEIWGSEYCCLQNFYTFFEGYAMKEGSAYTLEHLNECTIPQNIAQMQEEAKQKVYGMGGKYFKRIAIFGAGVYGRRILRFLRSRSIAVDVFLDNDPQKWRTKIEGIECLPVEEGLKSKDETLIILAAELFGEMRHQLEEMQITNVITEMHLEGMLYRIPVGRGEMHGQADG